MNFKIIFQKYILFFFLKFKNVLWSPLPMGTGFFLENIQTAIGNKDQGLFQKKKHYGHRYQWRLGFKKTACRSTLAAS
jgi:hypothetical protein